MFNNMGGGKEGVTSLYLLTLNNIKKNEKEDLALQNYVMISLSTLFGYGCLGTGMEFKDK